MTGVSPIAGPLQHSHGPSAALSAASAVHVENDETPGRSGEPLTRGFEMRMVVELRGVEPLASSMRPRRSSQLSYSPEYFGIVRLPRHQIDADSIVGAGCRQRRRALRRGVHRALHRALVLDLALVLDQREHETEQQRIDDQVQRGSASSRRPRPQRGG